MRIIAGKLKGKKILLPKDKLTRPLRDLVKESIFNLLEHSNKIKITLNNSNILDLFSGSGSFGLEAYSRGARQITFIENYKIAYEILIQNVKNLNCEKFCRILKHNCFDYLENIDNENYKFDLIFLDPPYKEKKINILLDNIRIKKILNSDGVIVIHRHKKDDVSLTKKINIFDQRNYGISKILFANFN